jgi:hypothetical protein
VRGTRSAQLGARKRLDGIIDAQMERPPAARKARICCIHHHLGVNAANIALPQGETLIKRRWQEVLHAREGCGGKHCLEQRVLVAQKLLV